MKFTIKRSLYWITVVAVLLTIAGRPRISRKSSLNKATYVSFFGNGLLLDWSINNGQHQLWGEVRPTNRAMRNADDLGFRLIFSAEHDSRVWLGLIGLATALVLLIFGFWLTKSEHS